MSSHEHKRIFQHWLHTHRGLFFKVVRSYAFSEEDRDDLFQEICVQVWKSIPNFRSQSSESTWIYKVALYVAMGWSRMEKKRMTNDKALLSTDVAETNAHHHPDPRLEWLYEQIAGLNEIDRSLTLLFLDGYSYKEIAEILGVTESNVGVKLNRIKKQFINKSQTSITNEA